jgi:ABC-type methionine transport system ATPase subunit
MLGYLSKINPDNLNNIKGINIIFVTHSPFILSDIPSSHIIRLENGKIKENKETFGTNIHDLLADTFFMPNGFMGEFAKEKINSAIEWLKPEEPIENEDWNKDKMLNFINMIGEPLIKNSLKSLYFEHFLDKEMIQKEIKRLNALLTE